MSICINTLSNIGECIAGPEIDSITCESKLFQKITLMP